MNAEDRRLAALLREAYPAGELALSVDLWPRFERRLDEPRTSMAKLDWLMAALAAGLLAGFPDVLVLLLYHL